MSTAIKSMSAEAFYNQMDPICAAGLKASLNTDTKVYDLQLMDKQWHHTYEFYPTEDLTSTAICLIGVTRGQIDPSSIDLDISATLEAMYNLAKERAYPGGFGLVLWANVVCDGVDLDTLQTRCGVTLEPVADYVSSLTTMETAWLVSGLAHEYKRTGDAAVKAMLEDAAKELMDRRYQPKTQTVAHAGEAAEFGHGMRRWIANFADQVYTIQALAFTVLVTGDERARKISDELAGRMVKFQGSLGQWWWHYDSKRGGSPQPYSVYSVHQHGMAPMALRALGAAGGTVFEDAITMSRSWLDNNELGVKMVDTEQPTIWRSLDYDQGKLSDKLRKASSLFGLAGDRSTQPAPALKLNYETRPYEWAWCAYAGAIERKIEPGLHLV